MLVHSALLMLPAEKKSINEITKNTNEQQGITTHSNNNKTEKLVVSEIKIRHHKLTHSRATMLQYAY